MTSGDDKLSDEDEVTVAANSDLISQLRDEAQELKLQRTAEVAGPGDDPADDLGDEVTVWRADTDADDAPVAGDTFDPDVDATAVMGDSDRQALLVDIGDEFGVDATVVPPEGVPDDLGDDATVVMDRGETRLRATPSVLPNDDVEPEPIMSIPRSVDDGGSLIGESAPPPTSATYWQPGQQSDHETPQRRAAKRRRLPGWLLALLAVIVIIGASVAIALLVASAA